MDTGLVMFGIAGLMLLALYLVREYSINKNRKRKDDDK